MSSQNDGKYTPPDQLFNLVIPELFRITTYMLEMVGFNLTMQCLSRFSKGLTTKKTKYTFTKFHITDLMPTSLRVKKLSVLDLSQGRLLMDSTFAQISVIPVSSSLITKAIASFEKISKADPSDKEADAELRMATQLGEILKSAKPGYAFSTLKNEIVKWVGVVEEGLERRKGVKRILVVTAKGLCSYKQSNLKQECWTVGYQRVGMIKVSKSSNQFKVCMYVFQQPEAKSPNFLYGYDGFDSSDLAIFWAIL